MTADAAAVRIAMTVAQAGPGEGRLVEIVREAGLDTDEPVLEEREVRGRINADLSAGADVTRVVPLRANEGVVSRGVILFGAGFIVTPEKARAVGLGARPGLEAHIRDYRNGRDLLQRPRGGMAIDLFGFKERDVMDQFPEVYQHVLTQVKPDRDQNRDRDLRERWWQFGRPRTELRPALAGLKRYIAIVETSTHRIIQFVDAEVLADNKIIVIADNRFEIFGVLQSRIHTEWAVLTGGRLGMGNDPVYVKGKVFDPFPFPDRSGAVAAVAERLDATRRAALAASERLTMTGLYNLVAAIRDGALPPDRQAEHTGGL